MLNQIILRTYILIIVTIPSFLNCFSQGAVGIGTNNPDSSAILDIKSGTKGILIPRINRAFGTTIINNPAKGLIVFNENTEFNGFEYFDGEEWLRLIATPEKYSGWVLPNATSSQIENTISPPNGLVVFDSVKSAISYYDRLHPQGGRWETLRPLPEGGIIMWSGSEFDIPEGFAMCDGRIVNGYQTPNLVSSFVRGSNNTSSTYSGAIEVTSSSDTVDNNLIYNINYSRAPNTPCSGFENIYSYSYELKGCPQPEFNGSKTIITAENSCKKVMGNILIPTGCEVIRSETCTVSPNSTYYALTPDECFNDNIFAYWDLVYIMRVK